MIGSCRRWLWYLGPRLLLALAAATLALAAGEVSLRLQHLPRPRLESQIDLEPLQSKVVFDDAFPGEWFLEDPPALVKHPLNPEHVERTRRCSHYLCNCLLNENLVRTGGQPEVLSVVGRLYTFRPPTDSVYPPYRFPPSVTLPQGLTTNKFGFRGPEIELLKPAHTIRIACVGSSTTCGDFSKFKAFSFPEHLQQFLNRWSRQRGLGLTFEVLNAGRAGINSLSIANVVRYEVLPLDVDYVVYHEGANQFHFEPLLKYTRTHVFGKKGLERLCTRLDGSHSVLLKRLGLLVRFPFQELHEPSKPSQRVNLPDGLDEFAPERAQLGSTLSLDVILNSLDEIRQDTRAHGARMIMSTFPWCVRDGMVFDRASKRSFHTHLNQRYWPATYKNLERLVALQNRMFVRWAADSDVDLIDVAGQVPLEPEYFQDPVHTTPLGTRMRAWVFLRTLVPIIERDLQSRLVPRQRRHEHVVHPWINAERCAEWSTSD